MYEKFRAVIAVLMLCALLTSGCSGGGGGWVSIDMPVWALPFAILGGASGKEGELDKETRVKAYNERMARLFLPGNCQVWWEELLARQGEIGDYYACGKAYGELLAFLSKRTPPIGDPRSAVIYELMSRGAAAHPDPETPIRDAEKLLASTGKNVPAKAILAASLVRGVLSSYGDNESVLAKLAGYSRKSIERGSPLWNWPTLSTYELGPFTRHYMPLSTYAQLRAGNGYVEPYQARAAFLLVRAAETALPELPDTPRTALALGSVYATMGWTVQDAEARRQWWDKAAASYAKALEGNDPLSAYVALVMGAQVAATDADRLENLRSFCARYPSVNFRKQYLAAPAPGNRTEWEVDFLALPGSPLLPVSGVPLFHTMEVMKTTTYWASMLAGNLSPWFGGADGREAMCAALFAAYGRPAGRAGDNNKDIYYLAWHYGGQGDERLLEKLGEQHLDADTAEAKERKMVLQVESAVLRKDVETLKRLRDAYANDNGGGRRLWLKMRDLISPFSKDMVRANKLEDYL